MGTKNKTSFTKENHPHHQGGGRPKGSRNKRTLLREIAGETEWERLRTYMETRGAAKLIEEMDRLKGYKYVQSYNLINEYVHPKLRRDETPPAHQSKGLSINHYLLALPEALQAQLAEALLGVHPMTLPEPPAQSANPPEEDQP